VCVVIELTSKIYDVASLHFPPAWEKNHSGAYLVHLFCYEFRELENNENAKKK
jgi:hypothetical protein